MTILLYGCSIKSVGPKILEGGVRFSVKLQNTKHVAIAGSFNQWDPDKDVLTDTDGDGIWSITLPLADGRYEYIFLVDGEQWLLDPESPFTDDGLGGRNSVISIKR
ncbi:MAG: hypothetical protein HY808_06845 [Nitrospirae bacterium]|nr:hypothetical protein [Nitrospirota bacterium]